MPLTNQLLKDFSLPPLKAGAHVAVACSGGSDSMALALLTAEWAKIHRLKLIALTVDHAMRAESGKEAKQVGVWLKQRGVAHHILRWEGAKPASNRQEAAREARYTLMAEYCRKHAIQYLLVAHTQNDQAETFLLRLMRGSGVDGLAAMSPHKEIYGITLLRPLLGVSRTQLHAYLKTQKQNYITDPSNEDVRYDRVKIRKLRPILEGVGITQERLARTAQNMARARDFLQQETERLLAEYGQFHEAGYAALGMKALGAHDEIALRALSHIIRIIGGQNVPLRLDEAERLLAGLCTEEFRGATLAGVECIPYKDQILFVREVRAAEGDIALKPDVPTLWDGRFSLTLHMPKKGIHVGALTQKGWLELSKNHSISCAYPSKKILYTLPALRNREGDVLAVPHLGFSTKGVKCEVVGVLGYPKRN